ncbi:MAG: HupE/UreJ family protein [Planctomycetales bacterium]|nr:HupE/UreJ family protein [Planctomycetales bacterium]
MTNKSKRTLLLTTVLTLAASVGPQEALWAHKPSDSYLHLVRSGEAIEVRWDVALLDLQLLVGLDDDADQRITWGEVTAHKSAIAAEALRSLRLTSGGRALKLLGPDLLVAEHSDGAYASLAFRATADAHAPLGVEYSLLFDVDPTHRGLLRYVDGDGASAHILSVEAPELTLIASTRGLASNFTPFVRVGVEHILGGYDHLLFLAALLLPAVLQRRGSQWAPAQDFKPTFVEVSRIVTMFTLAHCLTLWLAAAGHVSMPSRFVESTIAASIVIAAVNNLHPILPAPNWALAFGFGLIHGFGFAGALFDLELTGTSFAVSLLGFNVGVELGQLGVALVFLPLAYAARETQAYRRLVFAGGSTVVACCGAVWMVERLFNVRLLGA